MGDQRTDHSTSPAFRALSDAVLAISEGELGVDPILRRLVQAAQGLVGARYAAIGVPDGEGGFQKFIAEGMTEAQWDALGELPRTHGLLGAMLESREPYRTSNIQEDPHFEGWPAAHPNMRSFLGVPVVSRGEIVGAFYLTEKKGQRRAEFADEDEHLIVALAAHAAIALEHADWQARFLELWSRLLENAPIREVSNGDWAIETADGRYADQDNHTSAAECVNALRYRHGVPRWPRSRQQRLLRLDP